MNWLVKCWLSSPLAGEPPMLDGLLEFEMSQRQGLANRVRRDLPCPPANAIHIPCLRGRMADVDDIPRVSSPIFAAESDSHRHLTKRFAVEYASLLAAEERTVVATGNATYKSYRFPLRERNVPVVCWFVGGASRRNLKSALKSVTSIGKKRSNGFGRIARWDFEEVEHDLSWFAATPHGTLLMRPLPYCDQLPADLIGYRRDFCSVMPPYWHPERNIEAVVPC